VHLLIFLSEFHPALRDGTGFVSERPARRQTRSRSRPRPRPRIPLAEANEDEDEDENDGNKNAFISHKTENEGIQRTLPKTDRQAGLILLFAEKLPVPTGRADECSQT
jgi:hypothetical protein